MRMHPDLLAELKNFEVTLTPGAKVLDLGCGDGRYTFTLADNLQVTAVDINSSVIAMAEDYKTRTPVTNINFICADMTRIALPEGQYDGVLLLNSFHCLLRKERVELMHKIKKWLKPHSLLFMSSLSLEEGDSYPKDNWPEIEQNTFLTPEGTHLHFFRDVELLAELQGFNVTRMVKMGNGGLSKLHIVYAVWAC